MVLGMEELMSGIVRQEVKRDTVKTLMKKIPGLPQEMAEAMVDELEWCTERTIEMCGIVVIIMKEQSNPLAKEIMHTVSGEAFQYMKDHWDLMVDDPPEFHSKMLLWARDEMQKLLGYTK